MPKVKCPGCGGIFYETTEKFNPDVLPNGSFVRLIDPWKTWNWDVFDGATGSNATMCSQMNCTSCGTPLAPNGRLTVITEKYECPECGKVCKTESGLRGHMVVHGVTLKKEVDNDTREMEFRQYTAEG